jgi:hypothetical protein
MMQKPISQTQYTVMQLFWSVVPSVVLVVGLVTYLAWSSGLIENDDTVMSQQEIKVNITNCPDLAFSVQGATNDMIFGLLRAKLAACDKRKIK